ncbi:tryptophan--tRNA ligase [Candidatus Dojkabacteria bacterium]|nr:tryptophan--tRNA ligase [Candidatus Dojkabacteria bacterium]
MYTNFNSNGNFDGLVRRIQGLGLMRQVQFIKHAPIETVEEGLHASQIHTADSVSSIILKSGDKYFGVIRSNEFIIDMMKLKQILGVTRLGLLSPDELCNRLGFRVGAVGIYHPAIRFYMDESLLDKKSLYAGTGDKCYDIVASSDVIQKISGAKLFNCAIKMKRKSKRILTGDTPSKDGRLHLGHYLGSLKDRVELQKTYDTYILIANLHAYANYYDKSEQINEAAYNVFLDNLAVGIDPDEATIYLESGIPETFELYTFFLTMVKHNRVMRNPSVKEETSYKKLDPSMGFVCYPILQSADILGFDADLVPVGEDQMPVIEQVREIARDFNSAYQLSSGEKVFNVPKGKIGKVARLVGTDGDGKMSKSKGNCIYLSDDEQTVKQQVMSMYTDPNRIRATDPGKVEGNPVFIYHDAFNSNKDEVADLKERYKAGKVGDVEVKEKLFVVINNFLKPIRERRKYYEDRPKETIEILIEGTNRARKVVQEVTARFKEAVNLDGVISKS